MTGEITDIIRNLIIPLVEEYKKKTNNLKKRYIQQINNYKKKTNN